MDVYKKIRNYVCKLILLGLLFLTAGCRFFRHQPPKATPVSGKAVIAVDESLKPVMEAEIDLFRTMFGEADLQPVYVPENKAISLLVSDSVQLVVVTRHLRTDETEQVRNRSLSPREVMVARDAIALVTHPGYRDSALSVNQLTAILQGSTTTWNQLDPSMEPTPVRLLFESSSAGIARYLADSLCKGSVRAPNLSALNGSRQLLDWVASHPGYIGFIGSSWISNRNDSGHNAIREKLKILAISTAGRENSRTFHKPWQEELANGGYPLSRPVFMITTEPFNGPCTGLVSFVSGDKGQRVILKAGILPASMPSRTVNVRPNL